MLIEIKRLLVTITFLSLIITNILTLTNTAFNSAISGLIGTALGIKTVSSLLQDKIAARDMKIEKQKASAIKRQVATRNFGTRLASRTKRVAAKSIAAIPAEAIPFVGVAVLIADTGYELYAACETMRDLDAFYLEMGVQAEVSGDAIHAACNPRLPDAGAVWDGVVAKSGEWLDQLWEALNL